MSRIAPTDPLQDKRPTFTGAYSNLLTGGCWWLGPSGDMIWQPDLLPTQHGAEGYVFGLVFDKVSEHVADVVAASEWGRRIEIDQANRAVRYYLVTTNHPERSLYRFRSDPWHGEASGARSSSNLLTSIDHALQELEGRGVTLVDRDALRAYLVRHAAAADVLVPAVDATRSHFADRAALSLEIYRDPELGGEQLTLYVRSTKYSPRFLESLRALSAEIRSLRAGKDDNFLVTSDFQPPR